MHNDYKAPVFTCRGPVIPLMVLSGVEWLREPATLCSHKTSRRIFPTLATITQKLIEQFCVFFFSIILIFVRREHEGWAAMSVCMTWRPFRSCDLFFFFFFFFHHSYRINVCPDLKISRCFVFFFLPFTPEVHFSPGAMFSLSLGCAALFTALHPLQLVELQLCTTEDQRLPLLAKCICVATESLPDLLALAQKPPLHPWTPQSKIHQHIHIAILESEQQQKTIKIAHLCIRLQQSVSWFFPYSFVQDIL